jgi:hypothetical protein
LASRRPEVANAFRADQRLVADTCRAAVGAQRAARQDNTWGIWLEFCAEHEVTPLLENLPDPIPHLQIFAQRYRDGRLAKNGDPVRARTVEEAVRAIGQTMASLGAKDHRLQSHKHIEYRLQQLVAGWKRVDPAPKRVSPAPLGLVIYAHRLAWASKSIRDLAIADMAFLGFYFLDRPGEYTKTTSTDSLSTPFCLGDVNFSIGVRQFNGVTASLADIDCATFASLTFRGQKNSVRGEKIGHGQSGHAFACPVRTLSRRVLHLRRNNAPPDTPLYVTYLPRNLTRQGRNLPGPTAAGRTMCVTAAHITAMLRIAATACHSTYGINPADISARSLRAGGAMALLCAGVDTDVIRLVGRWRSDEMLRYLHLQAYPLMHAFASKMLSHGSYTLLPGQTIPAAAVPLLNQVPP